ncbi:MAG: LysR family transcriptional regulator [Erysipelotrichaceae bacterium]|nr:LysR family transcriptional regulator [Erysipelotrichaceae bacterium]
MTIRHFKIFIKVVQSKSITKAAKDLFISQPAVSLAIKEMEDYYGVKLFDRMSRRLYITNVGLDIYDKAVNIIKSIELLDEEIKSNTNSRKLKLGAAITFASCYLPNILNIVSTANINVISNIANSGNLIDLVLNRQLDLAVIEGPVRSDKLVSTPLVNDHFVLIVNKSNALASKKSVTLNDLKQQAFISRESDSGTRLIIDNILLSNNIVIEPSIISTSTIAIISAVKVNLGVSIISEHMFDLLEPDDIIKKTISGVDITIPFSIIYLKNKFLDHEFRSLLELINNYAY